MEKKDLNLFLEDISFNSRFEFLEESKVKEDLIAIAQKRGISLPDKDLSIFRCVYAFTERVNKNGCLLPKEEVKKSLDTLVGKAIDFDHLRKRVVGHWIDAKLKGDEIIATGIFFKSNFQEDYDVIKELFSKGNLSISFEAWGNRNYRDDGSYELSDISWAGGALLIKTEPAFDGAGVLEMAKNRVLEFAKVMTPPKEYISEKPENARMYSDELDTIRRMLQEVECLSCQEMGYMNMLNVDFENNKTKVKCNHCDAEMAVDLTPSAKLSKKGKQIKKMEWVLKSSSDLANYIKEFSGSDIKLEMELERTLDDSIDLSYENRQNLTDDKFAVVKTFKTDSGTEKKIRMFPVTEKSQVRNALNLLSQNTVQANLETLGINISNLKNKISRKLGEFEMKDLFEKYNKSNTGELFQEIAKASIGRELTKEELEKAMLDVLNINLIPKGKGTSSDNSLNNTPHTPANDTTAKTPDKQPDSVTSLQNATEEDIKIAIGKVVQLTEKLNKEAKEEAQMKEVIAQKEQEIAQLKKDVKEANDKIAVIEKAERDAKLKTRKDDLAEFANDMKDEDILDDTKFENAKLKKENAELRKGTKTVTVPADLTKGSKDKTQDSTEQSARNRVNEYAYKLEEVKK